MRFNAVHELRRQLELPVVAREDRPRLHTYKWTLCEGVAKPPMPKRKVIACNTTSSVTIEPLRKQIAELEAWKAEAIARYPDLAVPPLVKRARQLVAEMLRSSNDHGLAGQVVAGTKDGTMMMRVCVAALEESM